MRLSAFSSMRSRATPPPDFTVSTPDASLAAARWRMIMMAGGFACLFLLVAVRLIDVMVLHGGEQHVAAAVPDDANTAPRADIIDRTGKILATSVPTVSLYADTGLVLEPNATARKLVTVLTDLDEDDVADALKSGKRFVWLKRYLTPEQHKAVNALGLPGLEFQPEDKRVYPEGTEAAHVVGFTGTDGSGLTGIEKAEDQRLRSDQTPLALSIDIRLQHILKREIAQSIADFAAIGGAGLIMDVHTGEILASVSLPDFDPQFPNSASQDSLFSRPTLGTYEMGSTFKIFNTALALQSGQVQLADKFDTAGALHFGRFTIHDDEPVNYWMNVPEIFIHSSNIGSVRMVERVGEERQRAFLESLGLLQPPQLEVPEIGRPLVPNPWHEINMMTIAFGHGIAVSPVQLVTAVAQIVNGGYKILPTFLKRSDESHDALADPTETPIISRSVVENMRTLMRAVVLAGTGRKADVPGYLVGGKTGTAEKTMGKHYSKHAQISSFVGAFPINNPRYIVFAMIDEPHGNKQSYGFATGGWVAAPAVARIIGQMGPLLGIPPVDPNDPDLATAFNQTALDLIAPDMEKEKNKR